MAHLVIPCHYLVLDAESTTSCADVYYLIVRSGKDEMAGTFFFYCFHRDKTSHDCGVTYPYHDNDETGLSYDKNCHDYGETGLSHDKTNHDYIAIGHDLHDVPVHDFEKTDHIYGVIGHCYDVPCHGYVGTGHAYVTDPGCGVNATDEIQACF